MSGFPPCFDSQEDYDTYVALAARADASWSNYCNDCTARFRNEMTEAGRCSFPQTRFFRLYDSTSDPEASIVGIRDQELADELRENEVL